MPEEPVSAPPDPAEREPEIADFGAIAFILGLLIIAILVMLTMVHR
ncbi:MAG: hypothetical protein ABR598_03410 [Candidatus Dormibacteria bacterium]